MFKLGRKGFTLIELLVAISILGIVTVISLPAISRFKDDNKEKKYEIYKDSVARAGKLYTDQYAEDLFGYRPFGCVTISYSELVSKNLLKDIQISGMSCNTGDNKGAHNSTSVTILKANDQYYYASRVHCGEKKNDNAIISDFSVWLPKTPTPGITCTADEKAAMRFAYEQESYEDYDKKQVSELVSVESNAGFASIGSIGYGWYNSSGIYVGGGSVSFKKPPLLSRQFDLIKAAKVPIVVDASSEISTPATATGKLELRMTSGMIYNALSQDYSVGSGQVANASSGKYWVDNTAPTFVSGPTVTSSASGYNSLTPVVNVGSIEDRGEVHSELKDLEVCVKVGTGNCSDDEFDNYLEVYTDAAGANGSGDNDEGDEGEDESIADDNADDSAADGDYDYDEGVADAEEVSEYAATDDDDQELTSGNPIGVQLDPIATDYDGLSRTIHFEIRDKAGNITRVNKSYTVGLKCNLIYDSGCGSKQQFNGKAWGGLCKPTMSGKKFNGWFTAASGGTQVTSSTTASCTTSSRNKNVYAHWEDSDRIYVVITFKKNGASSIGASTKTCSYKKDAKTKKCSIKSPSISRGSPWTVLGWNASSSGKKSTWNVGVKKNFSSSKTYYAITKRKVTATFRYRQHVDLWNGGKSKVAVKCTKYNTATTCNVTAPKLETFPNGAKSKCKQENKGGGYYKSLFKVIGWSTSTSAKKGTAGGSKIAVSKNTTYYSNIKVNSDYVNKKKTFKVSAWTCRGKPAGDHSDKNVYNRRKVNASDANDVRFPDKSYIQEGEWFIWDGGWAVDYKVYKKYGPTEKTTDRAYLFLRGYGAAGSSNHGCCAGDCCPDKHCSAKKYCHKKSYIKAYHLEW